MWRSGTSCRLCVLAAAVAAVSGCASRQVPRIDPTGEHVFVQAPICRRKLPQTPATTATRPASFRMTTMFSVSIKPVDQVAQVGSEVILVAGVAGADGYLKAHRRLEWTISPGGVGQFTDIAKADCLDRLLGDNNPHQLVTSTYAVGSTLHIYERLSAARPTLRTTFT